MENEGKREVIWTNVDVGEAIFTSFSYQSWLFSAFPQLCGD